MSNESGTQLQFIDRAMLTSLVRQALGSDTAEVVNWHSEQIHASGTRARIYRLSGDARNGSKTVPWSLILKIVPFSPDRDDPSSLSYWKRRTIGRSPGASVLFRPERGPLATAAFADAPLASGPCCCPHLPLASRSASSVPS